MEDIGVRHVMKKQEQLIGSALQRLVSLRHFWTVLPDVPSARGYGAIHPDALSVSAMPLSPSVALRGFDARAIVRSGDVGERPDSKWARVVLVDAPGGKLHRSYCMDDQGIAPERQTSPVFSDRARADIGIPGQTSEAIQIRHRERMPQPVGIHSHISNADKSACGTMKSASSNNVLG